MSIGSLGRGAARGFGRWTDYFLSHKIEFRELCNSEGSLKKQSCILRKMIPGNVFKHHVRVFNSDGVPDLHALLLE